MKLETQRLTFSEKTGYAFGDAASNLFWMTFIYFQSKFYTDVFFYTPDAALERLAAEKAGGSASADARLSTWPLTCSWA